MGDRVTRRCPQTITFLKRRESRSGIEQRSFCLPAELTPYRWANPAHRGAQDGHVDFHTAPELWTCGRGAPPGFCCCCFLQAWLDPKLQALVYDILPSTTAVFSNAIGSRKLSANEQFFVSAQTCSSKFVTNNSDYIRGFFYNWPCFLRQLK